MANFTMQLYQPIGTSANGRYLSKDEWEKAVKKCKERYPGHKIPVCYLNPEKLSTSMDELMCGVSPESIIGWVEAMDNTEADISVTSKKHIDLVKRLLESGRGRLRLRGLCNFSDRIERNMLTNIRLISLDVVDE